MAKSEGVTMSKIENEPNISRKLKVAAAATVSLAGSAVGLGGQAQAESLSQHRPALSVKAGKTALIGYDVSYPQGGETLPKNAAFAIVGVNDTLPNNFNPYFSEEYKWAKDSKGGTDQPKAAVYVHVADPGSVVPMVSDWPKNYNAPGLCNHTDSVQCGFQYGFDKAEADVKSIAPNSPKVMWWIDIEPNYSWTNSQAKNAAVIEGEVNEFEHVGGKAGLYFQDSKTGSELTPLIGDIHRSDNMYGDLYGLPEWIFGATSLNGQFSAEDNCKLPSITGGPVEIAQIAGANLDEDIAC